MQEIQLARISQEVVERFYNLPGRGGRENESNVSLELALSISPDSAR